MTNFKYRSDNEMDSRFQKCLWHQFQANSSIDTSFTFELHLNETYGTVLLPDAEDSAAVGSSTLLAGGIENLMHEWRIE